MVRLGVLSFNREIFNPGRSLDSRDNGRARLPTNLFSCSNDISLMKRLKRMSCFVSRKNNTGQSLVQVVVGLALLGILAAAFVSLMSNQQNESKALSDKLASLETARLLIFAMTDVQICTKAVSAPGHILNTSALSTEVVALTSIPASSGAGAPNLITVGSSSSAISQTLKVNDIRLSNFVSSGLPNRYLADLSIIFDSTKLTRSLKPISVKITLYTDMANKIIGCDSGGSVGGPCPSGMMPINGGPPVGYCISEKKEGPDTTQASAIALCQSKYLGSSLCTQIQWETACAAFPPTSKDFFSGKPERNSTPSQCRGGSTNTTCTSWIFPSNCNPVSELNPFRCCR